MNGRKWTRIEDAILKALYPVVDTPSLAQVLDRSINQVYNRTYSLCVKKADVLKKVDTLQNACQLEIKGSKTTFKKGNKPWNTGMNMNEVLTLEALKKREKTQFKKGNKPKNTKAKGAISLRKDTSGKCYKYIKIADRQWELLHRYIWEKHNGPIPNKHIITFIDGDSLNCKLSNLKIITMEENVLRNGIHNYPSEAIPIIRLKSKLNKQIKLKQKQHGKKQAQ